MNYAALLRLPAYAALVAALLLNAGCATTQGVQGSAADDEYDPLEGFNRAMYSFNENVDKAVLKPLATGYKNVVPQPARTGVANFFNNLSYPIVILNDFLQGKAEQGADDLMRLIINSSFGLFGFLDVATPGGLPAHKEDFGQTLGYWGVADGAYIVLPFFGPSNVRDTFGLAADIYTDPLTHHDDISQRNWAWGIRAIDNRSRLLSAGRILDEAATDPYSFTREAYRQRRASQIRDEETTSQQQDFRKDE
ncbi:MAG: VacJ family lipoprotein [Pseudomonadota bacterium]